MTHWIVRRMLAALACVALTSSLHAAPVLAPVAPYTRVATYDVTENVYPHFGMSLSSDGRPFPTDPKPPLAAPLDPHLGYPDLTLNGPWVFTAQLIFELVPAAGGGLDEVLTLAGFVQHRDGGLPLNFKVGTSAASPLNTCDFAGPVSHGPATNFLAACLYAQRSSSDARQLLGWQASVNAWHVPEPAGASLALLGVLLALTTGAARRVRKR